MLRIFLDILIAMNKLYNSVPKFDVDTSSAIDHVVTFLKYTSEVNMTHEDALMSLFVDSLEESQRQWVKYTCGPKSIPSIGLFIEKFLRAVGASVSKLWRYPSRVNQGPSRGLLDLFEGIEEEVDEGDS